MDAVAYPESAVIEFVNNNLIPLRIPSDHPTLGPKYRIKWTPSLLILDSEGTEHYRTLGFFSPQELIPSLLLGMGRAYFNQPDRPRATACFERIIAEFPKSFQVPEAIYLAGVSRYIESHDVANLIGIFDRLAAEHPNSEWAMRADPYRLLKK
ncbi:MAG: tetratricopeptide repeat protein [Deltaproteobacteria bacterium]|nr:tetratricopeptide repeat protein [Deltaproteobacteria bacterium]MBF0527215.1 tetratricopeptide repeat protein [Deltaproteobacteria bacterium]